MPGWMRWMQVIWLFWSFPRAHFDIRLNPSSPPSFSRRINITVRLSVISSTDRQIAKSSNIKLVYYLNKTSFRTPISFSSGAQDGGQGSPARYVLGESSCLETGGRQLRQDNSRTSTAGSTMSPHHSQTAETSSRHPA
ncbi:hypothetical protein GE09DRAFT_102405 [Coniochaeta sp. 2T2.1]|nr:hypothetical protein GE09DRAFT_102405 [Coniochaeta sp. 2T2.1]